MNKNIIPISTPINQTKLNTSSTTKKLYTFDIKKLRQQNQLGIKLTEARKSLHISQVQLAKLLENYHISISAGAISKWEKGIALPNPYQLFAVCHILQINDILAYFTGSIPEAADFTPKLNQKGLHVLQAFKEALIASGQYTPRSHRSSEPEEMIDVKIYTQLTAAGTGNYIDDDHFGIISFPISKVPEDTDFGIRISGDSMAPRYVNKQIAMVDQCHELYSGEIGIFIYDGQSYIKEYHESEPSKEEIENYLDSNGCLHPKITLISLNKEYENIEVKPDRPFYIVGRVLN